MQSKSISLCIFVFAIATSTNSSSLADSLSYKMDPDEKYSYRFKITIEGDSSTTTYSGLTHYTAEPGKGGQTKLEYKGGLRESKVLKKQQGGFGPRFGRGFSFPTIASPFSRPTFRGKTQTSNTITITGDGRVVSMDGDSQLPYLLGNLSLMPFELLPDEERKSWTSDAGIAITSEKGNSRFGMLGPGGPFGNNREKSRRSAAELTRYDIKAEEGELVRVGKLYELTMPSIDDKESFEMAGTGTWIFNKRDGCPQSTEMTYKLTVKSGNSTTILPIAVKFDRVSAEELLEIEAEAKRKAEERATAIAAAKAEAERPLTAAEKQQYLVALASGDSPGLIGTLGKLARKMPQSPDPEIVAAIDVLLESNDKAVKQMASAALIRWSPEYKKVQDLQRSYSGAGVLKSTDREVNALTSLYEGQIAQVNEHGPFWKAAKIKEIASDGKVAVQMQGGSKRTQTFSRRQIQLAPEDLPQPERPANFETRTPIRTWSDSTGLFKFEGSFVKLEGINITLKSKDGRDITIPVAKLNAADQEYLQKLTKENPFAQ